MLYKTIVMELINENPALHEELRVSRQMLPAIETFARQLRERHLEEATRLEKSAAFEIALDEMRRLLLPQESPFNLDEAMLFLKAHSPSA